MANHCVLLSFLDAKRFEYVTIPGQIRLLSYSEQYPVFYGEHPEWEAYDEQRRQRGGPLGIPGTIDRPNERPNVAAMLSTFCIPQILGHPDVVQPKAHPHFGGQRTVMNLEEASERVKGFARHLGADLVGITKLSPTWVYAKRGEIFYGRKPSAFPAPQWARHE